MRKLLLLGAAALLLAWISTEEDPLPEPPGPEPGCVGGCAAVPADVDSADDGEMESMVEQYALGSERALEELLYYWREVEPYLEENGRGPLSEDAYVFLRSELARHAVRVTVRIGDEEETRRVRLGKRSHLGRIAATVQRVGLKHLWARL